jgi:hypothetical protein
MLATHGAAHPHSYWGIRPQDTSFYELNSNSITMVINLQVPTSPAVGLAKPTRNVINAVGVISPEIHILYHHWCFISRGFIPQTLPMQRQERGVKLPNPFSGCMRAAIRFLETLVGPQGLVPFIVHFHGRGPKTSCYNTVGHPCTALPHTPETPQDCIEHAQTRNLALGPQGLSSLGLEGRGRLASHAYALDVDRRHKAWPPTWPPSNPRQGIHTQIQSIGPHSVCPS